MTLTSLKNIINAKVENTTYQRFTNEAVETALDEGLLEIAINTNEYSASEVITTTIGTSTYELTDICNVDRAVLASGDLLSLVTEDELDELVPDWWSDKKFNSPKFVIYDRQNSHSVRLFPAPSETISIKLRGKRLPSPVATVPNNLDLNPLNTNIIVFFVASSLLSNTGRTEDIQRASQFYQLYSQGLKKLTNRTIKTSKVERVNNGFR